jgi:DNA-binding HxlR family transcriptional regulator
MLQIMYYLSEMIMPKDAQKLFCPVEAIARILSARWTLKIIHHLRTPRRFCELQALVGNVNPTTLTQRLKFLEQEKIIERVSLSQKDHIAQYQLTQRGQDLLPIIDELAQWSYHWLDEKPNPSIEKSQT